MVSAPALSEFIKVPNAAISIRCPDAKSPTRAATHHVGASKPEIHSGYSFCVVAGTLFCTGYPVGSAKQMTAATTPDELAFYARDRGTEGNDSDGVQNAHRG